MSDAQTPTQQIVNAAQAVTTVTDADGRSIRFRKLGALDKMRAYRLLDNEDMTRGGYMFYVLIAMSVLDIDGVPIMKPANQAQLEALVERLGDAGVDAISAALTAA